MSVQTQIDRISGNVSAALSAIAEKGVTVPDGSTSDALHDLILSIEAGGSASGFAKVATGTIILSSSLNSITIEHGLGQVPDFAIAYNQTGYADFDGSSSSAYILSSILSDSGNLFDMAYMNKTSSTAKIFGAYSKNYTRADCLNETNAVFDATSYFSGSKKSTYFEKDKTYRWIAGVYA